MIEFLIKCLRSFIYLSIVLEFIDESINLTGIFIRKEFDDQIR